MKKLLHFSVLSLAFLSILCVFNSTCNAEMVQGVVVVGERKCSKYDAIVIYTNMGYVAAEVYSGNFDKDDIVIGDLNSYGFKDVLVNGRSGRLYIDDYMLNKERAASKCWRG